MHHTEHVDVVEDSPDPYRLLTDILQHEEVASHPFLLESALVVPGLSRWSFLGINPFRTLMARETAVQVTDRTGRDAPTVRLYDAHPLDALEVHLAESARDGSPESPFCGGAVGYLSYDLGRLIEPVPMRARHDLPLPDLSVSFYNGVVAHDHLHNRAHFFATPAAGVSAPAWLQRAAGRARALRQAPAAEKPGSPLWHEPPLLATSNMGRLRYEAAVRRVREYIAAGDVYQVNLTHRFSAPCIFSPLELYGRLRQRSPAPFAAFLDFGAFALASSSPERFLRFDAATRMLETRPIKGTRPRGASAAEDEALERELLASEKDAAELLMIVDLERNDLGRVCDYGTVAVPTLRDIERYATVLHTVATIRGRVGAGTGAAAMLRATFPGGSITGAPKIRAMQVIDELEPHRRGLYTGAIGYFDFGGNFDLSIAIRTIVSAGGRAYFGVGGGIVADSLPDEEYEETLTKARAMLDAVGAVPCTGSSG
jgi:para-aminobenzoate synthetase component 1